MSSLFKSIVMALSFVVTQAQAQDIESAPQEPPYVQEEIEFETEAPSVEDEIESAAPETKGEEIRAEETVNLNEDISDAKIEEELSLEEDQAPVQAESEAEVEEEPKTPVVAEPPAVVEVKPAPAPVKPLDKVVRRSARGGVEYIEHPQAAQGLTTITKEGAYIYRTVDPDPYDKSGSFRFGLIDPPRIVSADGTTDFKSMYSGSSQPLFMFDYEWQALNGFGKLGIQAGFGFMVANGNGRFIQGDHIGEEAKEKYTFLAIPLNLGGVYRLEWSDRQWVAPYIAAGGTYVAVAEIRDDGKTPSAVGTPGFYGAGGLLLNISAMDREAAFTLKSEYGIHNLWVSLDYRYLYTFSEDVDFTSGIAGAGITVDY